MKRNNIILIVIAIILIVGVSIGVTLYEQQQVKLHLTKANEIHTQMMNDSDALRKADTVNETAQLWEKNKPLFAAELNELRAANSIFASSIQKEYITATIEVNTGNDKKADVIIAANKLDNLSEISGLVSRAADIDKEQAVATAKRDSIVAAHPEEFGFVVVKI